MPKPTNVYSSRPKSAKAQSLEAVTATLTTKDRLNSWQHSVITKHWRFALSGMVAAIAASAVGLNMGLVSLVERQVQSLFFELRGPVSAPENIVILEIDDDSLAQGKNYSEDPERYESLEPIETWPWQRSAYAQVIERLMEAGAAAVAVDLVFSLESTYGDADDAALTKVIERYGDRIVLAVDYEEVILPQGIYWSPTFPIPQYEDAGARLGIIDFHKEPNQQIHRLGQEFVRFLQAEEEALFGASATVSDELEAEKLSFAQAAIKASGRSLSDEEQENIFFFGPANTFQKIPFWKVLDDDPWQTELKNGEPFKDKTVLIGWTASRLHDVHKAPFSESALYPQSMTGVEVLSNAIATLQGDLSPTRLIRRPSLNALLVIALGLAVAGAMSRTQKPLRRLLIASGSVGVWAFAGYAAFVWGSTIVLTGIPILMLTSVGLLDFGVGFAADRLKRKRLRRTLARYATSPLVQEIISQQDDFQDLLDVNRTDLIGTLLRDRYKILRVLGAGGFGETYLAQDTLRPSNPVCVVKQLKIVSDNPKAHRLARRLFESEAIVLGQLGEHNQIPRLLAYFEVQESFYLVQEMIEGKLLRDVLSQNRPLPQRSVVRFLLDLLPVINFVHSKGVIHRDIKPSNIIRRAHDRRYVLIDFGAVKTISNKLADAGGTQITSTVGIGTQGYMPSEQSAGMPTVRSDIYALGVTAIEAITGRPPHVLKRSEDGEIIWSHAVTGIDPALSRIISKMVRYDFNNRYTSAQEVITELENLDFNQLTEASATAAPTAEPISDTTYNQGTRPGVIETNPELGATEILPTDWPNAMPTKAEDSSVEQSDD